MAEQNWNDSTIFIGDNLKVMREMNSGHIDLIYLADKHPALYSLIKAVGEVHGDSMKSYLIYMVMRILEMKRLLKPTGSIYLHCDPTAGHYLKLTMDAVFGVKTFQSEIIWKRINVPKAANRYGAVHDVILHYSKSDEYTWNPVYIKNEDSYGTHKDNFGRFAVNPLTAAGTPRGGYSGKPWKGIDVASKNLHWIAPQAIPSHITLPKGYKALNVLEKLDVLDNLGMIYWPNKAKGMPRFKRYESTILGTRVSDIFTDISSIQGASREKTGYPTQKPLALLYRIIEASSNKGDIVFDPFAGCTTTCIAASKLERNWVGIDISPKAGELIRLRMEKELGLDFAIHGNVTDKLPKRSSKDRTEGELFSDVRQLPYNHPTIKQLLFGKQEERCNGCQEVFRFKTFEIDHITPRSKGGKDHINNLQLLCPNCNRRKGNKDMKAFVKMMLKEKEESMEKQKAELERMKRYQQEDRLL